MNKNDTLTDYKQYRGRCKELAENACAGNPDLTLVRGHYDCPLWGMQAHWWTVNGEGKVFDPSKKQFPSKGIGEYIPFDGVIGCSECGRRITEEEADIDGNYAFCSRNCHLRFIGLGEFI